MNIVCLDLEGVLVPEIWIAFAEESGIPELKRTTRDEPDYDKLMHWRLGVLKEHGLGLKEIQETIAKIDPLPGAKEFLDELRATTQVIIISDTFTQFAGPLMKKLGYPTIFCNSLEVAPDGEITGFKMRCENSKRSNPMTICWLPSKRHSEKGILWNIKANRTASFAQMLPENVWLRSPFRKQRPAYAALTIHS